MEAGGSSVYSQVFVFVLPVDASFSSPPEVDRYVGGMNQSTQKKQVRPVSRPFFIHHFFIHCVESRWRATPKRSLSKGR